MLRRSTNHTSRYLKYVYFSKVCKFRLETSLFSRPFSSVSAVWLSKCPRPGCPPGSALPSVAGSSNQRCLALRALCLALQTQAVAERQLLKWNHDPAAPHRAGEVQLGLDRAWNREAKLPGRASGRGRGRSRHLCPRVPAACSWGARSRHVRLQHPGTWKPGWPDRGREAAPPVERFLLSHVSVPVSTPGTRQNRRRHERGVNVDFTRQLCGCI